METRAMVEVSAMLLLTWQVCTVASAISEYESQRSQTIWESSLEKSKCSSYKDVSSFLSC